MGKRTSRAGAKTARTAAGHVREVKIDRVGPVTIYRRGDTYYLYYTEGGQRKRPKIDGNLAVAKATAADVAKALAEDRASPLTFQRTSPSELVEKFIEFVRDIQRRAYRTWNRYRAALELFVAYTDDRGVSAIDRFTVSDVEDFVGWLRSKKRNRNGRKKGKKDSYQVGGIKFVLSTCRTAFNWARRNRRLPPYTENPFSEFPSDLLGAAEDEAQEREIFTETQESAFFQACNPWQRTFFVPLAAYGMRVAELTHLLIENVDFDEGVIRIRSKPELFWLIKTRDRRDLPITGQMAELLLRLIGDRESGFVFLNEKFYEGKQKPLRRFSSDRRFREYLQQLADEPHNGEEIKRRRAVREFCRDMGQIPEKRPRLELMKITEQIGCPEFTRAHDLRHLFGTRSQDVGGNPLLIQQITGHRSMDMLKRYTHFDMQAKRSALEAFHTRFVVQESEDASGE
jgi:integrase